MSLEFIDRMDEAARKRWRERINAHIARWSNGHNNRTRQVLAGEVARRIPISEGAAYSDLSRIRDGQREKLRVWFDRKAGTHLKALAEVLTTTPEELLDDLRRAAEGEAPREQVEVPWHPLFPGLLRDPLEIPARLKRWWPPSTDPEASVDTIPAQVLERQKKNESVPQSIVISGVPGSGREAVARLVRAALVHMAGTNPKDTLWRDLASSVQVADVWEQRGTRDEDKTVWEYETLPWGLTELRALGDRILAQPVLTAKARDRLAGFRAQLESLRSGSSFIGLAETPGDAIALLAGVVRDGAPKDGRDARRRLTAAAWGHLVEVAPSWQYLGPEVLETFCRKARLAGCGADWTRLSAATAIEMLEAAVADRPHPDRLADERERLLSQLETGSSRERRQAAGALRALLARRPGVVLVGDLCQAGILRRDGDCVEVVSARLARIWAARGIASAQSPLLDVQERLLDSSWLELIPELVYADFPPASFVLELEKAPAWAAFDVGLWLVRFVTALAAATKGVPIPRDRLVLAWAGTLWGMLHGLYSNGVRAHRGALSSTRGVSDDLRQLSFLAFELLPELEGPDPVETLRRYVPSQIKEATALWRDERDPSIDQGTYIRHKFEEYQPSGVRFELGRFRFELIQMLEALAPCQRIPPDLQRWQILTMSGDGERLAQAVHALEFAANHGHAGAAALLAGASCRNLLGSGETRNPEGSAWLHVWRALPWAMRAKWLTRGDSADDETWYRFGVVAREAWTPPKDAGKDWRPSVDTRQRVLELLLSFPRELLQEKLEAALEPFQALRDRGIRPERDGLPFSDHHQIPDVAMALSTAERHEMLEVLEAATEGPRRWLEQVRLDGRFVSAGATSLIRVDGTGQRIGSSPFGLEEEQLTGLDQVQDGGSSVREDVAPYMVPGTIRDNLARRLGERYFYLCDIALAAAAALHRLGRPERLRRLWTDPPPWLATPALWNGYQTETIRLALSHLSLHQIGESDIPLEACQALPGVAEVVPAQFFRGADDARFRPACWPDRVQSLLVGNVSWLHDALALPQSGLPASLEAACRALLVILRNKTFPKDPAMKAWLWHITHPVPHRQDLLWVEAVSRGRRLQEKALDALVDMGDEVVLEAWLQNPVDRWVRDHARQERRGAAAVDALGDVFGPPPEPPSMPPPYSRLTREARTAQGGPIPALLRQFPKLLERAWDRSVGTAAREDLRSAITGWIRDKEQPLVPPRWLFEAADRSTDPEEQEQLMGALVDAPDALPILRRIFATCREPGARWYWAGKIGRLDPSAREPREVVWAWAELEQNPFGPRPKAEFDTLASRRLRRALGADALSSDAAASEEAPPWWENRDVSHEVVLEALRETLLPLASTEDRTDHDQRARAVRAIERLWDRALRLPFEEEPSFQRSREGLRLRPAGLIFVAALSIAPLSMEPPLNTLLELIDAFQLHDVIRRTFEAPPEARPEDGTFFEQHPGRDRGTVVRATIFQRWTAGTDNDAIWRLMGDAPFTELCEQALIARGDQRLLPMLLERTEVALKEDVEAGSPGAWDAPLEKIARLDPASAVGYLEGALGRFPSERRWLLRWLALLRWQGSARHQVQVEALLRREARRLGIEETQ